MHHGDHRFHPTAHVEITHHTHPFRRRARNQIVENTIHCSLVKNPVVPVAPQIKLEALELQTFRAGNICNTNCPEIRRATLEQCELFRVTLDSAKRAERRELRAVHVDLVVTVGVRIVKCLEELWPWHPERCTYGCRGSIRFVSRRAAFSTFPRGASFRPS